MRGSGWILCRRHGRVNTGRIKLKEGFTYVCPYCSHEAQMRMRKGRIDESEYQVTVTLLDGTRLYYEERSKAQC